MKDNPEREIQESELIKKLKIQKKQIEQIHFKGEWIYIQDIELFNQLAQENKIKQLKNGSLGLHFVFEISNSYNAIPTYWKISFPPLLRQDFIRKYGSFYQINHSRHLPANIY